MTTTYAEVEVSAGVTQTIDTYSKIIWQHQLNGPGYFEVLVVGSDTDYVASFQKGSTINFYKNNTLDMKAEIEKITFTSEGIMRIQGTELGAKRYSKAMSSQTTFSASTTALIVAALNNNASGVSVGTVDSAAVTSFRTYNSQTCLQGLQREAQLEGKDWYFDYSGATVRVNLVTHKGVTTPTISLSGKIDIGVVTKEEDDTKKVKKVTVIGKGEGANQITGNYSSGWAQGDSEITIIDKSINTVTEATARATVEYNIASATRYNYLFSVLDPERVFTTGDVIHTSDDKTSTDADVRIVSVKRVLTMDREDLQLEVRATTERERAEDRLAAQKASQTEQQNAVSMTQPTDNGTAATSDSGHLHADGTYGADSHPHDDGTYAADSHPHADGTYGADSHDHSDGTLTADNHPHADGSYAADATTSGSQSRNSSSGSTSVSGATTALATTWTDVDGSIISLDSAEFAIVVVIVSKYSSASTQNIKFRLKNTTNTTYSPDSGGVTVGITWLESDKFALTFLVDATWSGDGVRLQGMHTGASGTQLIRLEDIYYTCIPAHTHSVPSTGVSGSSSYYQPGVSGNAGNNSAGVSGSSGNTAPGVSGNSGNTAPGVSGDSATNNASVTDAGHHH